jgi:hypothetical protein
VGLRLENVVIFMAINNILRTLVHFVFIWYILCSFGTFFPVLVSCTKKNLATLHQTVVQIKLSDSTNQRTRDRCYDFLNIFAKKFCEKKSAFLTQNKAKLCKILIITLVFEKNANFSPKIAENRRKL